MPTETTQIPAPGDAPTAVLYMPQGSGKSTHAATIAALLGCTSVADEWTPGNALVPGALHLTNSLLKVPQCDVNSQIEALEQRAKVGLGFAALTGNERTFAFFQPQLHILKLLRDGTAQRLAEKDAGLGGYEANAVFNAAASCLTDDAYNLTRAEVLHLLAVAGVQATFDAMAQSDFATSVQLENSAIAAVNSHNEHPTPWAVGNDGADLLHAGPPIDVVAYFAQQGGAQ